MDWIAEGIRFQATEQRTWATSGLYADRCRENSLHIDHHYFIIVLVLLQDNKRTSMDTLGSELAQ